MLDAGRSDDHQGRRRDHPDADRQDHHRDEDQNQDVHQDHRGAHRDHRDRRDVGRVGCRRDRRDEDQVGCRRDRPDENRNHRRVRDHQVAAESDDQTVTTDAEVVVAGSDDQTATTDGHLRVVPAGVPPGASACALPRPVRMRVGSWVARPDAESRPSARWGDHLR